MVYIDSLKTHKKNNIIANIWKVLGMKISLMTIDEHDKIMSITSHLPHLPLQLLEQLSI